RLDEAMNDVDLLQRLPDGVLALGIDIRRPELRPDAALLEQLDVSVQLRLRARDVEGAEREVIALAIVPGEVVVPVDQQRVAMNLEGLRGELDDAALGLRERDRGTREEEQCTYERSEVTHGAIQSKGSWNLFQGDGELLERRNTATPLATRATPIK